jgi:poly(A) polymerase/tRNA nucleotidyltransferase (CCA-adding enzyme)
VIRVDSIDVKITTYHTEGECLDSKKSSNVFVNLICEDLVHRDITINSIAFDPLSGTFIDPFNGLDDIRNQKIVVMGNMADSFSRDYLRLLKTIRFSSQLGFKLDSATLRLISLTYKHISKVSMEKIRDEFIKIIMSDKCIMGIKLLCDTGLMGHIIPRFNRMKGCLHNKWHSNDVFEHSIAVMGKLPSNNIILRLAGLLHDIGKPDTQTIHPSIKGNYQFIDHENVGVLYTKSIMARLKFPRSDVKEVVHLVKNHMKLSQIPKLDGELGGIISYLGTDNIESFVRLNYANIQSRGRESLRDIEQFNADCIRIDDIVSKKPVLFP